MSMNSDKNEIKDVIGKLNDPDIEDEVNDIKSIDPLTSLKLNLFGFFESRLRSIEEEDNFEKKIKAAIQEKIDNQEMSTAQLMQLYNSVKDQGSRSLSVLLDIFKPSQTGNVSPLVEEKKPTLDSIGDSSVNEFKDLEPDEQDTLHKLSKLINEFKSSNDE